MLRQRHLRDRLVFLVAPAALVAAVAAAVVGFGLGGGAVALALFGLLLVAVGWAVLIGRSIIASIDDLTAATATLARSQNRLATEEVSPQTLPQLDGTESGPLGGLATAIDGLGRAVVEAAQVQRENVRKGLATMVINLARRNQSLLDRQVELLDELEQGEEDAERLDQLFRVDHLSTRMRRNAESLLVLAGSESGRRRGAPVPIVDVLRVAIGEVEQYQRIELGRVDDGMVPAGAAVDLAHLTAELMENATQFSPPSTAVEVQAAIDRRNNMYMIAVVDRGTGLGERLEAANRTIAEPPELGLDMGRSLGFMVIGRLARRLGATIRLRPNNQGGTVAVIAVPLSKLVSGPTAEPGAVPPAADAPPEPTRTPETAPETGQLGQLAPPAAAPAPAAPVSTNLEKLLGIDHSNAATAAPSPGPGPSPAPPSAAPPALPTDNGHGDLAPAPVEEESNDWQRSSPFAFGDSPVETVPSPAPEPAPTASEATGSEPEQADALPPVDYLPADATSSAAPEPIPAPAPAELDPLDGPDVGGAPIGSGDTGTDRLDEGLPSAFDQPLPSAFDDALPSAFSDPQPAVIDQGLPSAFSDPQPAVIDQGLPSAFDEAPPVDADEGLPSAFGQPPSHAVDQGLPSTFGDPPPSAFDDALPSAFSEAPPGSLGETLPGGLDEALPSGARFDAGVDSLLAGATGSLPGDDHPQSPTGVSPESAVSPDQATQGFLADPERPAAVDRFGWPAESADSAPSSLFGQPSDLTPARITDPEPPPAGGGSLRRRERGASKVPIGEGRPVAASSRSPEEVRSLLSRYRNGLRRGGKRLTGSTGPDPSGNGAAPDQHHPNDERR